MGDGAKREDRRASEAATTGARPIDCPAVALHVDPRVDAAALEDPDDPLIDDLEAIASLVQESVASRGFLLARRIGNAMLFVREVASWTPVGRVEGVHASPEMLADLD